jgi:hypothetical protein
MRFKILCSTIIEDEAMRNLTIPICAFLIIALLYPTRESWAQKERVTVAVYGDTAVILNAGAVENCAARHQIEVTINGANIRMLERDTVEAKANCICNFDFTAVVGGLLPGAYHVDVVREYLRKYWYPADTIVLVGSADFEIVHAGIAPELLSARQSPCSPLGVEYRPPAGSDFPTISILPHPVTSRAVAVVARVDNSPMSLLIADASGRVLRTYDDTQQSGESIIPIDASEFPSSGVYFLSVVTARGGKRIPFLIVK